MSGAADVGGGGPSARPAHAAPLRRPPAGEPRILVTGARGMLGAAVLAAVSAEGCGLIAASRARLDITDAAAVDALIAQTAPTAVINCAAWTDVDGAEGSPERTHAVNADGAGNVARACKRAGARLVHVSTDYVFDGRRAGTAGYVESDATGPRCVYGATKLAGESQVQDAGCEFAIARTAWLFGAGGRNFVDTMLSLRGQEEVTVVTDQIGCPTWTGHLAPALVTLALRGPTGIVHVAGAGRCSWNELAREVFAQVRADVNVLACTSEQMSRPAPRPAFSVLVSERPQAPRLPDWRDGVRGHLHELAAGRGTARSGVAQRKAFHEMTEPTVISWGAGEVTGREPAPDASGLGGRS